MLVPARWRPQRGGRAHDRGRGGTVPARLPRSRRGRESTRRGAPRPGRTVERHRPGDPRGEGDRRGSRRPSAGSPPRRGDPAQAPRARQPRARDRGHRARRPGPRRADRPSAPRSRRIHRGRGGDAGGRDRTTYEVVPRRSAGALVHGCDRRRRGRRHRDGRDRGGRLRWARAQARLGWCSHARGPAVGSSSARFRVRRRGRPRDAPSFRAVGEWYERFDQVQDREVLDVLGSGS
jgi:hypothetical protein